MGSSGNFKKKYGKADFQIQRLKLGAYFHADRISNGAVFAAEVDNGMANNDFGDKNDVKENIFSLNGIGI